jgi:predicted phosphodiesterase
VLSDIHFPFHDRPTLELAIEGARKDAAAGVLINGDLLECIGLSSKFHKRPDSHTFRLERQYGVQFFEYLRYKLPRARVIFKAGNHDERLENYIAQKAPELFDIEDCTLQSLLELNRFGVEFVGDRRLIYLGKLPVLHGHEYQSGISAPVNPARGAFLRAFHNLLVGHSHQISEHHERDITGKEMICWSTGCCCTLRPRWKPFNKWSHGFARVDVSQAGQFVVRNLRVFNGNVI